MAERCWAFLAADFEAAAREAEMRVSRLRQLTSNAASAATGGQVDGEPLHAWLQRQPEWIEAQRALTAQLTARGALDDAGLSAPAEALATAERAHADFSRLWKKLRRDE